MPSQNVLRWLDGRGWLVLTGLLDESQADELRGLAVARSSADGAVACVVLSGDPDAVLDDLNELGAPSSYLVDVYSEDDETMQSRLSEAGVVVVTGGNSADEVRSALRGAAIDAIQEAHHNGAVIVAEGRSAGAFGTWLVREGGQVGGGLEWVDGAFIAPTTAGLADDAHPVLEAQRAAVAIGIGEGSALALGPDGQVETWGRRDVKVLLGAGYTTPQNEDE